MFTPKGHLAFFPTNGKRETRWIETYAPYGCIFTQTPNFATMLGFATIVFVNNAHILRVSLANL